MEQILSNTPLRTWRGRRELALRCCYEICEEYKQDKISNDRRYDSARDY